MEYRDLKAQYKKLKPEMDSAISEIIENSNYISGRQVGELEEQLAAFIGAKHCISCGNGTDALMIALMAWGIGEGDAVFVPDFTFFSTGEAPAVLGAVPIFLDVDPATFNMSIPALECAVKRVIKDGKLKPKVVIPVDLFGLPAEHEAIRSIAEKYGMAVLEDGAQGFGGNINGKRACSFGDISTTSFFPAKPLGCYGDGGAIFTDDDETSGLLRSICVHGKGTSRYDNVRLGMNSRLDTLQAAILKVKLKAFAEYELNAVNEVAAMYDAKLKGKVITPKIPSQYYSSWAQYTIRLKNKIQRDNLQKKLKENGIPSMIYYIKPMHAQKAFKKLAYYDEDYPETIKLCDTVLSLPMHPYLDEKTVDVICSLIEII